MIDDCWLKMRKSKTLGRSNSQIAAQVLTGLQRPPSPRPSASLSFSQGLEQLQDPSIIPIEDSTPSSSSSSYRLSSTSSGGSLVSPKHNISWTARAKNWGASRAVQSKALAKALFPQFLGSEGSTAFNSIVKAVHTFHGEQEADLFEKHAVSTLLKLKVLFDDGIISMEHIQAFQEVLQQLMAQLEENLAAVAKHEEKTIDLHTLQTLITDLEELSMDFFQDLLKKKYLDMIKGCIEKMRQEEFLKDFFQNPAQDAARSEAHEILQKILRIRSSSKDFICRYPECDQPSVKSEGSFMSSGFCSTHHIEYLNGIITRPEISYFLQNDNQLASSAYREFLSRLSSSSKENEASFVTCFDLICAIRRWKTVQSREIKLRNARSLANTFLCHKQWVIIQLPDCTPEQLDPLFAKDDRNATIPSDFFDELMEQATAQLEKNTFSRFLSSDDFKRFIAGTTLPIDETNLITAIVRRRSLIGKDEHITGT